MDRRRLIAFPLALAASLILATAALSGGWATVALDAASPDPGVGGPVEIDLTVLQHGVTPINWIGLTVVATSAATGEVVTVAAHPAKPLGRYVATLTFPSAGDWAISYESGDLIIEGSARLSVAAAASVPAAASVQAGSAAEAGSIGPTLLVGLLIALLVGGLTALVARDRRASRGHRPAPAGR